MSLFEDLRAAIRAKVSGRVIIGHGNRAEASWLNLVDIGALPTFNFFFTAVAGNGRHIAEQMFAMEDEGEVHPDLVWGHDPYWQKLDELLGRYPKAILFCTYRKPQHEELLKRHPEVLLSCPPQPVAGAIEDKARFHEILSAAGVQLTLPTLVFNNAAEISSYDTVSEKIGTRMVLQIVASAGGARHDLKSSVSFVHDEAEFEEAKLFHNGHGQIKIVTLVEGRESNGAGLALPWGTYVDPPSHKPVGLKELWGRPGSGSGNDWTWPYHPQQVNNYRTAVERIGCHLAQLGFHGVFGFDSIFPAEADQGPWGHEINGRTQGTTESQEVPDLLAKIPSLPMMAVAHEVGVPQELFPDPESYNAESLERLGEWYLKINVPRPIRIELNLNGLWRVENGHLVGLPRPGTLLTAQSDEIYIYGAPQAGKTAQPGTGLPTLYVNGFSPSVFTPEDTLTDFGEMVRQAVYQGLGFKEGEF